MEFAVNTTTGTPIYQQLAEQICAAIARGRLRPGDRLPSVRELSQSLVINPNTAARAYTELEREGTLYTRPGMGVFVSARQSGLTASQRRARLNPAIEKLLIDATRLGCSAEEVLEIVGQRLGEFQWAQASAP